MAVNLWTALSLLFGLAGATLLVVRTPPLRAGGAHPVGAARDVAVIIPARNEGTVLGGLLDDLVAQLHPPARIVVVDDHSHDDTVAVVLNYVNDVNDLMNQEGGHPTCAGNLTIELRRSAPIPEQWNPKSWALHQGVAGAQEARLLFLDADVRLDPTALGALAETQRLLGGLVSVAPRHDIGSWPEALSLPFNLVALMGAAARLPWGRRGGQALAAFGPCLLVDREGYQAAGGHGADHGDLLDDVALAHRYRDQGGSLWLRRGGELVRYRMYPHGRTALVQGWTKNIASGAARTPLIRSAVIGWWVSVLLVPLWWLGQARRPAEVARALGLLAVVAAHTAWLSRRVGQFGLFGATAPFLAVFFVAVVLRSALFALTGHPVRWKDRQLMSHRRPRRTRPANSVNSVNSE